MFFFFFFQHNAVFQFYVHFSCKSFQLFQWQALKTRIKNKNKKNYSGSDSLCAPRNIDKWQIRSQRFRPVPPSLLKLIKKKLKSTHCGKETLEKLIVRPVSLSQHCADVSFVFIMLFTFTMSILFPESLNTSALPYWRTTGAKAILNKWGSKELEVLTTVTLKKVYTYKWTEILCWCSRTIYCIVSVYIVHRIHITSKLLALRRRKTIKRNYCELTGPELYQ